MSADGQLEPLLLETRVREEDDRSPDPSGGWTTWPAAIPLPRSGEMRTTTPSGDELGLRGILRLMRRRAGMIVCLTAALMAIAVPPILTMERDYAARLRLLMQRPAAYGLAGAEGLGVFDLGTEIERLLSQANVVAVIDDLDLIDRPEFLPSAEPSRAAQIASGAMAWLTHLVSGTPQETPEPATAETVLDTAIAAFYGSLSVRRTAETNVVDITFRAADPKLAAAVPNDLVKVYLSHRKDQANEDSGRARDWLAGRIEEQKTRLVEINDKLISLRTAAGQISDADQAIAVDRLGNLNERAGVIAGERSDLAAALEQIAAGRPAPRVIEDAYAPLAAGLRAELLDEQRQLSRVVEQFGPDHVQVTLTRKRIEGIVTALDGTVAGLADAVRARIATLDAETQNLTRQLDDGNTRLSRMSAAREQAAAIEGDLTREQATLAGLEDRLRTVEGLTMLPVAEIEVLSPAAEPRRPDGRGRSFYLLLAMIAAISVSITVALVRELMDTRLRSLQQLVALGGVIQGGLIPSLPRGVMGRLPSRLAGRRSAEVRDAVHGLALALESDVTGGLPGSILVTSTRPGDGRTFVSVALALHIASTGRHVILVDAGAGQGRLHVEFGSRAEPGLSDLLNHPRCAADVRLRDVAPGIDLVPRGTLSLPGRPAVERIRPLLGMAAAEGAVVVIDGGPALADSAALQLAGLVERNLLVVEWAAVPRRIVTLAIERLARRSRSGVAVVLNRVSPRGHASYSFGDSDLFGRELRAYRRRRV